MYTLTVGYTPIAPGTFTLEFRGLLEAAETYKLLTTNGLPAYLITVTENGEEIDLPARLDGMARLFAGTPAEVTDNGWWND